MTNTHLPPAQQMLAEASNHLRSAIDLLDRAGAAGHIAAHADLALNELERLIASAAFGQLGASDGCLGTA